jgi:hypothetical protein
MPFLKPHIPLPKDNRHKVWDVLRAYLAADGTELKRWVKTWQLADGDAADLVEPESWAISLFPLFRLRFEGNAGQWRNEVTSKSPLDLVVTLGLPGNAVGDVFDAWAAVERRFFPGDKSLYAQVKPLGVVAYSISQPGITAKSYQDGRGQVVTGRVRLEYEFRTQY